jgi:hypothetical protein
MGNKARRAQNRSGTRGQLSEPARGAPTTLASGGQPRAPDESAAERTATHFENIGAVVSCLVVGPPAIAKRLREGLEGFAVTKFPRAFSAEARLAAKRGAGREGGAR